MVSVPWTVLFGTGHSEKLAVERAKVTFNKIVEFTEIALL
jgi:hypothetical protein